MFDKLRNDFILNVLVKVLICNLIFLILIVVCKNNQYWKDKIYSYVYDDNINFYVFKDIYNKYLGGVSILGNSQNGEMAVFDEKINYSDVMDYYDGVKLKVSSNYLVPSMREGIVVYIGQKDKYGSVVIIEDNVGFYNWYGNVCNISLSLYDYVKNGDYIGESCKDYIYLVFSRDNVFFDYHKFINN